MSEQTSVVYLVVSEESFGRGIIGAFSTLDLAIKFAEDVGKIKNMEYTIYTTVVDRPSETVESGTVFLPCP